MKSVLLIVSMVLSIGFSYAGKEVKTQCAAANGHSFRNLAAKLINSKTPQTAVIK
jgi:hypothetical protein